MRISDWSSDVCSSDLVGPANCKRPERVGQHARHLTGDTRRLHRHHGLLGDDGAVAEGCALPRRAAVDQDNTPTIAEQVEGAADTHDARPNNDDGVIFAHGHIPEGDTHGSDQEPFRTEEHTSELQSLIRISYAA